MMSLSSDTQAEGLEAFYLNVYIFGQPFTY